VDWLRVCRSIFLSVCRSARASYVSTDRYAGIPSRSHVTAAVMPRNLSEPSVPQTTWISAPPDQESGSSD
jgi:hypothetical protein